MNHQTHTVAVTLTRNSLAVAIEQTPFCVCDLTNPDRTLFARERNQRTLWLVCGCRKGGRGDGASRCSPCVGWQMFQVAKMVDMVLWVASAVMVVAGMTAAAGGYEVEGGDVDDGGVVVVVGW
ncbi:hypothetical protein Tco_1004661 [Tanacetum coccineum]|uniref:Uncharacterized protein n=1 Tax=Tanacetum coccineum TaxID=301880 RepID=A0ABQ5FDZ9_9ASTR